MPQRTRSLAALLSAATALGCGLSTPRHGERTPAAAPGVPDAQAMMEAWEKTSHPGPFHAHLKPLEGKWTFVSRLSMDPAAPPSEGKGTCEYRWIFGGRYLEQHAEGETMGKPFQGLGLLGYDNIGKKYVTTWCDSMSTGIFISYGTCDASGKAITFQGEYDDPVSGKKKRAESVLRILDDGRHSLEAIETTPDGKDFTSFEIIYTRA